LQIVLDAKFCESFARFRILSVVTSSDFRRVVRETGGKRDTSSVSTEPAPEFVKLSSAARRLAVDPRTLLAAVRRGELHGVQLGPRGCWRLEAQSLERLIERKESR